MTAVAPSVGVETFSSFEDAEAIAAEWDALVERLGGSLYVSSGWCAAWWRHYGAGRQLRVVAVREDGELIAVLPFFVERLASPAGRCRTAKLVGSDSTIAFVDPPLEPRTARHCMALAMRRLFEQDRVDIVHVGPYSSAAAQAGAIRDAAGDIEDVGHVVRAGEAGAHTLFELPDGFEAYLQSLSKNQRSNYRRNLNKLNKAFAFDVDVISDPERLDDELEPFMAMHQAQWNAVNKLGHFGDWPHSREFTRDLVRTLAPADRVRMIRLLAGGEVVSYYFCFAMGGTYYWRLPARLVEERWDQFALGRVGLMKMMEVAAAEGATAIEAGNGRYEYKDKLNARTVPLLSLTVVRNGAVSRARARMTLAWGDLIDFAYYRGWYLRLAPKLPLRRRALRRSWIRRRF